MVIELTYDCQLRCPWCLEKQHVSTGKGAISKQAFEMLMQHIIKERYNNFIYQGGEPLMYPTEMLEITDIIRREIPESSFRVFTNGINLTENLVTEMNRRKIGATIAVEAEGYKGLKNIVNKAIEADKIITSIKNLTQKNIRTVTQRQKPFAENLLLLHAVFPDIEIETVPDYTSITLLTYSDLKFMQKEYQYIKEKLHGDTKWLSPMQAFYGHCDLEADWYYLDTGLIKPHCPQASKVPDGCRKFALQMSPELFELFRQIIKEVNA